MIQAMSTGHPGSMCTGHGNNSLEMLDRIALMILMNSSLPWEAIRRSLLPPWISSSTWSDYPPANAWSARSRP